MKSPKRYLVTSALPYANGPLHIGHIAGAYLPADIFVRYLRLQGKDVLWVCGSDEHGAAITIQAKKEDISPQEIVDKYHGINKKAFADFSIDFDHFHRTSDPLHHKTASEFFTTLNDKGKFIEKESEQFYDAEFDQFLADRYIKGTCPRCQNPEAYGDQCENCGSTLSPDELGNPVSALSGNKPEKKKTTHWYLQLDKDTEWLKAYVNEGIVDGEKHHDAKQWKKNVTGQVNSWLNDGLKPRAITRDLSWGVPVPIEGVEGKVLYVWLDAPIGYISASKAWAEEQGKDWKPYWQDDDTELLHFIGKDNIVFHTIIFPSILKSHGDYILPTNVPANEFLNLEGDKMSTSRNWAIWLHEYIEAYPEKIDELRFVLASISPETKDSEFTWADYQARVNSDLVGIIGNFVNRIMVLTHKYYDGIVPEAGIESGSVESEYAQKISTAIEAYRYRDAISAFVDYARNGNVYLTEKEPWKQIKENPEEVKTTIYNCLQKVAHIGMFAQLFIPNTASKIFSMLGLEKAPSWEQIGSMDLVANGHKINEASLLFEKIEDEWVENERNKLMENKKESAEATVVLKENIGFEDFTKLDIRTGTILSASAVEKADKLLELRVDLGFEKRTIISGVAHQFQPADIIGQKVSVVCNLAPKKIRGVMSNGMILMAEDENGKLSFIRTEEDMGDGLSIS